MISPNDTTYINCTTTTHTMEWQYMIFRGILQRVYTPQLLLWTTFIHVQGLGMEEQKPYGDYQVCYRKYTIHKSKQPQLQPPCQTQQTLILTLWSALARSTDKDGTASVLRISCLARPIECSFQLIKQLCSICALHTCDMIVIFGAACPPEMKSIHCFWMSSFFGKNCNIKCTLCHPVTTQCAYSGMLVSSFLTNSWSHTTGERLPVSLVILSAWASLRFVNKAKARHGIIKL